MNIGVRFEEADVVANYKYRPPYAEQIFEKLLELAPGRGAALDLGCGPGKVTFPLAAAFDRVTAVDPSTEMINAAKRNQPPHLENITWINAAAEEAEMIGRPYDLITAGASIHWMDHAVVFPKLREAVADDYLFAVISGDGTYQPPWQEEWEAFLTYWVPELTGNPFSKDPQNSAWLKRMRGYRSYIDILGEFSAPPYPFQQSIDDFIALQYSRATFARSNLGDRKARFEADLRNMLSPYAEDGFLTYTVRTKLVYGTIKG